MTFADRNSNKQEFIPRKINKLFKVPLSCYIYSYVYINMSAVPQGMFAARKVRQNEEKLKNEVWDLTPTKYSSKYMNSVWGMYNRYSVHNFKKNIDGKVLAFSAQQEAVGPKQSGEKNSSDFKGSLSSAKNLLPSPGYL